MKRALALACIMSSLLLLASCGDGSKGNDGAVVGTSDNLGIVEIPDSDMKEIKAGIKDILKAYGEVYSVEYDNGCIQTFSSLEVTLVDTVTKNAVYTDRNATEFSGQVENCRKVRENGEDEADKFVLVRNLDPNEEARPVLYSEPSERAAPCYRSYSKSNQVYKIVYCTGEVFELDTKNKIRKSIYMDHDSNTNYKVSMIHTGLSDLRVVKDDLEWVKLYEFYPDQNGGSSGKKLNAIEYLGLSL